MTRTRPSAARAWWALLLAAILPLAACERPASRDDDGPRYAVLSPALAVILRDLGHEDRIVARHAHDIVLDESLPIAGELGRIDYEALLAARPTHVIIEWGAQTQPLPDRLIELSRRRGFSIHRFSLLTLADIRDCVDRLERDLPRTDRGPRAGLWQERMDRLWAAQSGAPGDYRDAGRILLVAATTPTLGVTGPGSWHHQILVAIGGTPAVESGAPWIELAAEDVLALSPDAILIIQPRGRDEPDLGPQSPDELLARLGAVGRLDIPAVRSRRIARIDDPLAHTPSTAMLSLTDQMARILHAWATQPPAPSPP